MLKKPHTAADGYVALLAVIIISAILLVVTMSAGTIGWSTRLAILGVEAKEASVVAAYGCAEYAIARVITDPTYTGNATTSHVDYSCYVFPLGTPVQHNTFVTVRVRTILRHSYTTLEVQYDTNDIHISGAPIMRPADQLDLSVTVVRRREL